MAGPCVPCMSHIYYNRCHADRCRTMSMRMWWSHVTCAAVRHNTRFGERATTPLPPVSPHAGNDVPENALESRGVATATMGTDGCHRIGVLGMARNAKQEWVWSHHLATRAWRIRPRPQTRFCFTPRTTPRKYGTGSSLSKPRLLESRSPRSGNTRREHETLRRTRTTRMGIQTNLSSRTHLHGGEHVLEAKRLSHVSGLHTSPRQRAGQPNQEKGWT